MWTVWTTIQIGLVALGLLLVYGGNQLARPILMQAGIACLGIAMLVIGMEAIITRRLIRWKRGRPREAYVGIPAILHGIQFNAIGLSLIGVAIMMYFNNGREIFQQVIRRPGLLLVLLGGLALVQMAVIVWGSRKPIQGSEATRILGLIIARLFPGFIWLALGLGLIALGVFDILAPTWFDEMGGRLLEELYGSR